MEEDDGSKEEESWLGSVRREALAGLAVMELQSKVRDARTKYRAPSSRDFASDRQFLPKDMRPDCHLTDCGA